jgi:hypothetical protein
MAQGSKGKYTAKQKRKANKIAEGYEKRGTDRQSLRGHRLAHRPRWQQEPD